MTPPPARASARVQFVIVGHGRETRAELRVVMPDGEERRYPMSELGLLRAIETGAIAAAVLRRQKAPHEG